MGHTPTRRAETRIEAQTGIPELLLCLLVVQAAVSLVGFGGDLSFLPNFTTPLFIRGDELRVLGSTTACLPARNRLKVGEFYLLSLTSCGDMQ
jgi:hypothetical protein